MNSNQMMPLLSLVVAGLGLAFSNPACGDLVDLIYEFDGDSDGMTSFGTVELTQDGSSVDFEIIANTANLIGGDIHEFYFNLPDAFDISSLFVSDFGGVSDLAIAGFSSSSPASVAGAAGASFDAEVNFGNGAGPPGNGLLTTASFSLTATGGLSVSDFFSETSTPNNVPPVFFAVHFQSADVFGNGSETVGNGSAIPEPGSVVLLLMGSLVLVRIRQRT